MTQQTHDQYDPEQQQGDLSRRDFVAMGLAAGVVAAGIPAAAAMPVVETMVEIKTPDGTCDAAFSHPTTGSYPAVIIWADAFGLRPALRDMGKRLAGEGYAVLVPNPYYRVGKGTLLDTKTFNFQNDRAKLTPLMGSIQADGAAEKDAAAFVAWLDTQKPVNASKKIGTQGYCMGGPLVMRTSAAMASRIGAGGSFHGGVRRRPAQQPTPAHPQDQGEDVLRRRQQRRQGAARRQGRAESRLRRRQQPGQDRGLRQRTPRLVHVRHAGGGGCRPDLQPGGRRTGVGRAPRLVQGRPRLTWAVTFG
jgi:dienelactone hydrolase